MPITDKSGEWRNIPGYDGRYQASVDGEVRRIFQNGNTRYMTPYHKKMQGSQRLVVKLSKHGYSKEEILMQLIAKTFLNPPEKGMVLYHIDGCQNNNSLVNLAYKSRKQLGKLTGGSARRKPVVKIDTGGYDVEYYYSAREAARKNFMSYQTIIDRCNAAVKRGPAPDGYEYAWDDSEVSRKKACMRLGLVTEKEYEKEKESKQQYGIQN